MFKNSSELLDYALRELQVAVENDTPKVVIILEKKFNGDDSKIKEFCNKLQMKEITELLREEFSDYEIKSVVNTGLLSGVLTLKNSPCALFYPLVWKLTLRKKAV